MRHPLSACGLVGQFCKAKPVHFWRAAKTCVVGLNFVKQDLEEFQREYYQRVKEILGESKRE